MDENEGGADADDQQADDREERELELALGLVLVELGQLVAEFAVHRGVAGGLHTVLLHSISPCPL